MDRFEKEKTGVLPWTAQSLAKLLAQRWQVEAGTANQSFAKKDFERAWHEIYSGYKWLCKIKHPTFNSALHDSMATSVGNREYVVLASPDIREVDLPVKATILTISISRVREAIRCFAVSAECDDKGDDFDSFKARMERVITTTKTAFEAFRSQPLPFDIADSTLTENYRNLSRPTGSY